MKTRQPLVDFDAEDLPSAALLSIARARARQERKNRAHHADLRQQLDVLRGAWTAGRSLRDPVAWRRYVEAKAAGLTAS
ncbi:hypothetical protein Csp1_25590 [Corynebacterium provencense]|uniref:Uncharacterized protein n=1 Tax=Corynebacterium provencense TaxID=1737425 RepID=A0A2Z3YYZ0_9CORY|nr:hypothetical protein [Corynebacterium provencense]AWT27307.1 hypothetical protein Csp1_25590 [Corynebacterium provencense]